MAIVECIPEKKQTPSAQKGVIDYCMQPSKTYDEDEQLAYVSGYNCVPALANESFLATQKVFGHEPDGIRFYHYVYSEGRGRHRKASAGQQAARGQIPKGEHGI